jgi:hypothetical protein
VKHLVFYKCRWCGKVHDRAVTTNKTREALLEAYMLPHSGHLTTVHECDDVRSGVSDLIGVRESYDE